MLLREILLDVVGTSGYRCGVLRSFPVERIEQGNEKADEGFFVGYSVNSKAFRVFNSRTRIVEETLHITFLENKPNVAGSGPEWLFDIDTLTKSMNYKPVVLGNQTNGNACTKESIDVGQAGKKTIPKFERLIVHGKEDEININSTNSVFTISSPINTAGTKDDDVNSTNSIYTASPLVNFDGLSYFNTNPPDDPKMPNLEDIGIFVEPKKVIQALTDLSWIKAMQDELLQFKLQKVWTLVDLPYGKRAIGTKWVYMNKKDERGIVVRNKARLVAQGYTKEEGIDYDEVFALVARIEVIRLFLAYASFMNFVVYQMDVKSAFLYGKIEEEVYVCQPLGFEDLEFPNRVYKVEKALYGLHQAPRAWYETLSTYLLENRFQRGTIDKTLLIKKVKGGLTFFLGLQMMQKEDGIFISQEKYVDEILKKFGFSTVRIASTPMETSKPLLKDAKAEDVDVHLYRSMIGSLMYLTASRPDIMFADLPLNLEAYSDSDYAGASLDKKSTTGGCQFLRSRLISWQCKKKTIAANSTTEAELMIGMGWTYYLDKIGVYSGNSRVSAAGMT
ncbi:putative ribonuclease H-like domain-containing protein [Tanacetum coccineum]